MRRVEDIIEGHVGANTMFAFESAILKAIAKEQKKEVWQLVNSSHDSFAKTKEPKLPRLVGNCIGGGKHSSLFKKPDFQEFLLIPKVNSVKKSFEIINKAKKDLEYFLKKKDDKFFKKGFNGAKARSRKEEKKNHEWTLIGTNLKAFDGYLRHELYNVDCKLFEKKKARGNRQ